MEQEFSQSFEPLKETLRHLTEFVVDSCLILLITWNERVIAIKSKCQIVEREVPFTRVYIHTNNFNEYLIPGDYVSDFKNFKSL